MPNGPDWFCSGTVAEVVTAATEQIDKREGAERLIGQLNEVLAPITRQV